MTVDELIDKIVVICPGADPAAIKAMKPVYHAHLDRFDGAPLQAAFEEVMGSFRATVREPFPKPHEFKTVAMARPEAHQTGAEGPPIRRDIEDRRNRAHINIQNWIEGQGAKVKATRHDNVYRACLDMARDECARPSWRYLTAEQIKLCERRAISQERVRRFGPIPKKADAWWTQIQSIAADWNITLEWADWQAPTRQSEAA